MFRQSYQDLDDPQYNVCCCGHVRRIARIFAIIHLILFLLEETLTFFAYPLSFFLMGPLMFIYILVLIGDSKSSPKYYIPVLILEFIIAIVSIAFTVVNVIDIIPKVRTIMKEAESGVDPDVELFSFVVLLGWIALAIYSIWSFTIFYRARNYLIKELRYISVAHSIKAGDTNAVILHPSRTPVLVNYKEDQKKPIIIR